MSSPIEKAVDLLKYGDIVAVPSETVYGLAADATNDEAIEKIYRLKNRPPINPLIIHVSSIAQALEYGVFSDKAHALIDIFWPGPLTVVVPRRHHTQISNKVSAGLETIAIRMPDHPLFNAVIKGVGKPIAAPSANISGRLSPTHPDHIHASFGKNIPFILDGGRCSVGIESTIISVVDQDVTLLREGFITQEKLLSVTALNQYQDKKVISPGQLLRHYAPLKPVYIGHHACKEEDGFLAFGTQNIPSKYKYIYQLSEKSCLHEAAYHFYLGLHYLDQKPIRHIYCSPIPHHGIGASLNDKLKKIILYKDRENH